ncbi:hypothetical protein J3F84DRAFT_210198 [Trichoderma pleuroticola]
MCLGWERTGTQNSHTRIRNTQKTASACTGPWPRSAIHVDCNPGIKQPRSVYPCLLPPTRAQMPRSAPKLVGHHRVKAQKLHAPRFDSVRRSGMEGCVICKCVPSTALGRLSPCRLSSAVHTILCLAVKFFLADMNLRFEWIAGTREGGGLFWSIRVWIVSRYSVRSTSSPFSPLVQSIFACLTWAAVATYHIVDGYRSTVGRNATRQQSQQQQQGVGSNCTRGAQGGTWMRFPLPRDWISELYVVCTRLAKMHLGCHSRISCLQGRSCVCAWRVGGGRPRLSCRHVMAEWNALAGPS